LSDLQALMQRMHSALFDSGTVKVAWQQGQTHPTRRLGDDPSTATIGKKQWLLFRYLLAEG